MNVYSFLKPLLFRLPPETVHERTLDLLEILQGGWLEELLRQCHRVPNERLSQELWHRTFPGPVGLAPGFDKNARVPGIMSALGFGHVEVGAVTSQPQEGNPRPRLFRLPEDRALINRMGFNNEGVQRVAERLARADLPEVPLGINLGKSKVVPREEAAADYETTYRSLAPHGDYFVVNVSSPNTPGLRSLQDREPLERILDRLKQAGAEPLLVKVSPDLAEPALEEVLNVAEERQLDGFVATNTSVDRPGSLRSDRADEEGGLSGRPIEARSTEMIRWLAERTDRPIIGVGGIFTVEDAYRKIRAGAHLVQIYTGLVYRGPGLIRDLHEGLAEKLEQDGFEDVEQAVGSGGEDHEV